MRHGNFLIAAQMFADVVHIFSAPKSTTRAVILCGNKQIERSKQWHYSTQAGDGRRVCRACARLYEKLRRGA